MAAPKTKPTRKRKDEGEKKFRILKGLLTRLVRDQYKALRSLELGLAEAQEAENIFLYGKQCPSLGIQEPGTIRPRGRGTRGSLRARKT